jgi:hypothetical protein
MILVQQGRELQVTVGCLNVKHSVVVQIAQGWAGKSRLVSSVLQGVTEDLPGIPLAPAS